MKTPDFTPAGIGAILLALITNLIVLFDLDLSDAQRGAITGVVSAVVLAAFLIHDAVIRHGRANVAAAAVASGGDTAAELAAAKGEPVRTTAVRR
jgi:hypothetical protein